jgi:hypothetical protein
MNEQMSFKLAASGQIADTCPCGQPATCYIAVLHDGAVGVRFYCGPHHETFTGQLLPVANDLLANLVFNHQNPK